MAVLMLFKTYRFKHRLKNILLVLFLLPAACAPVPRAAREPLDSFQRQAEIHIAQQQYSQAVKILEDAAIVYPNSTGPLIRIGQIYLKQRRWLLAADAFNRALARDKNSALAVAGLAEATLPQGHTGQALALWQKAAELNPALPGVFAGLGRTHLARLEFEEAQTAFLAQLEHQPDPDSRWFLAALAAPLDVTAANNYLLAIPPDANQEVLARRDYLLATLVPFTADSPRVEVARATGVALVQIEAWPLAVHALRIAAENSTGVSPQMQAETLAFLGYALARAGRPALELFQQAQALNPESALPLYFYGIYLREQGALHVAEDQFKQAIKLDPENVAFYLELARTKTEQGDFGAAEQLYATAADIAGDNLEIQLSRARFHASRGYNLEEVGIPAAEAVVKADKENAEAHDLLGWMQFLAGQPEKAEAALRKAIELDPNLISARYHLARHFEANGQSAAAIAEYQRVVDLDTGGIYREQALLALQRLKQAQ